MKCQLLILMLALLVQARRKQQNIKLPKPNKGNDSKQSNEESYGNKTTDIDIPKPVLTATKAVFSKGDPNDNSNGNNGDMSFSLYIQNLSLKLSVPASFFNLLLGGGHRGPPTNPGSYERPGQFPIQGSYERPEQFSNHGDEWKDGMLPMLCWDWTLDMAVLPGGIMTYNNKTYTCTENDWEMNAPEGADGCWCPTNQIMSPYGMQYYYCCDLVECKENGTWQITGDVLPQCGPENFLCHNVMTNETVVPGSTMYFECNQYMCMEGHDWTQTGERDPACDETNGCFSTVTQEIVPHGVQGYYKCESVECMPDNKWKKTGSKLQGCGVTN